VFEVGKLKKIMSKKEWHAPVMQLVDVKAATQGNGAPRSPGDACNYAVLSSTAKCISGA
jgi:hypothetical protein